MMMDEDEVLLKAGDMVIQRGTNHAWSNRGTEPCVIALILVEGVTTRDAPDDSKTGIPKRQKDV